MPAKPRIDRKPEETSRLPDPKTIGVFAERLPAFFEKVKKYNPDIIVAVDASGRPIAHFVRRFGIKAPIYFLMNLGIPRPGETVDNPLLHMGVEGKRVLVIDDFVFSGRTAEVIGRYLQHLKPKELGFMSMSHFRHDSESDMREAEASVGRGGYRKYDLGELDTTIHALAGGKPVPVLRDWWHEKVTILNPKNYDAFLKSVEEILKSSNARGFKPWP
ncbi:MAG: phosphoribosyltransferase [Candidatus Micrarchaeota archaeon]